MTVVDILIIIGLIVVSFYIGFRLGYFYHSIRMLSVLDETIKKIEETSNRLTKQVETIDSNSLEDILFTARSLHLNTVKYEMHNDQHLLYSYVTDEFLCQGTNLDDAVANLIKINLGDTLVVDTANNRGFFIIDGEIQNNLEYKK